MTIEEVWKDIPGYNKYYQVSSRGRVRSWKNARWGRADTPRLMKPFLSAGYPSVHLSTSDGVKRKFVHRLVAKVFIPNPGNKAEINHIDGTRTNNCATNLEWCTHKENMRHAMRTGAIDNTGENCHNSKLTENDVLEIRERYSRGDITLKKIGKEYGVSESCISSVINKRSWRHI